MANMTQEQMVNELSAWSVAEVAGLVKALEEKWGVSAAPVAVAGAAPAAGGAAEAAEEQTEFTVELASGGDKKIQVIKVIREITSLGLADAKKLVEEAPKVIKEAVSKEEAADIKKKVEEAGGQVTVK